MYYTLIEVMELADVSRTTLYRYLNKGIITTPIAKNKKGQLLFTEEQLITIQNYITLSDKTPVSYVHFSEIKEEESEEVLAEVHAEGIKEEPKKLNIYARAKIRREEMYGKQ